MELGRLGLFSPDTRQEGRTLVPHQPDRRQRFRAPLDRYARCAQCASGFPILSPFRGIPFGSGARADEPFLQWMPIHRARENPNTIAEGLLRARSEKQPGGYLLEVLIPAEAMTGYDPEEHPRLGFTYAVVDRELGEQTLSVGSPFPYREDPGLWATLELLKS